MIELSTYVVSAEGDIIQGRKMFNITDRLIVATAGQYNPARSIQRNNLSTVIIMSEPYFNTDLDRWECRVEIQDDICDTNPEGIIYYMKSVRMWFLFAPESGLNGEFYEAEEDDEGVTVFDGEDEEDEDENELYPEDEDVEDDSFSFEDDENDDEDEDDEEEDDDDEY